MTRRLAWLALLPMLASCGTHPRPDPLRAAPQAVAAPRADAPPFTVQHYEPFARDAVVAIALREWRLFGMIVDDDPPGTRPPPSPDAKPERAEGLWQRVGEYWWLGMEPGAREAAWTGKHDERGAEFPAQDDAQFAWSAAFISYVMRVAGAGERFPYSAAHHDYIDAARETSLGRATWAVSAEPPDGYAPQPGDLICFARDAEPLRFTDLPAGSFPAHCAIVTARQPGTLDTIGGNVDDAVALTHVPITADGLLAEPGASALDPRYPWFVVLRVLYER